MEGRKKNIKGRENENKSNGEVNRQENDETLDI